MITEHKRPEDDPDIIIAAAHARQARDLHDAIAAHSWSWRPTVGPCPSPER